jgi:hypothetical protein
MPRYLTKLKIKEVSSVDKGAGDGVKIILMKRDDDSNERDRPMARRSIAEIFDSVDYSLLPARRVDKFDDDDEYEDDLGGVKFDNTENEQTNSNNIETHPQVERHVAALRVANPNLSREDAMHYLLHSQSGRDLARHLTDISKIQRRADNYEVAIEKHRAHIKKHGIVPLASYIVRKGRSPLGEHEFTELLMEAARLQKKENESDAQAFARLFENDLTIRKAHAICKSIGAFEMGQVNVAPSVTETGRTDVESDAKEAYDLLMQKAEELRASSPYMTIEQTFSRVFQDSKNSDLAARAHRRPTAI